MQVVVNCVRHFQSAGVIRRTARLLATNTAVATTATSMSTATPTESPSSQMLDPTEVSLGISCYRSSTTAGFSAVSKARFSDFVVHESEYSMIGG